MALFLLSNGIPFVIIRLIWLLCICYYLASRIKDRFESFSFKSVCDLPA